jgi:two-component system, NarL family, invasion response regulator UvrY
MNWDVYKLNPEVLNSLSTPSVIRVAIVDDNPLFTATLKTFLNNTGQIQVVFEAFSGEDALTKLAIHHLSVDIVILDFLMPVLNGKSTAKQIRDKFPEIRIIVLSYYRHDHLIIELLKVGISGFASKSISPAELLKAIDIVYRNEYYLADEIKEKISVIDHHNLQPRNIVLTELQKLFIKLCSTGFSYKEIASRMNLSPRTIHDHRDRLFEKLQVSNRVEIVIYGIKNGIIDIWDNYEKRTIPG